MEEAKKAYGQMLVYKNDDGKAVVEFEGLVTSDVPLDTESQDFANAINELAKKLQQGGGGDGKLRGLSDGGSENLTVTIDEKDDTGTDQSIPYQYKYEMIVFEKELKYTKTTGDTTTEHKQTFSKTVITALYDTNGTLVMRADCDGEGNVLGYYNGNGEQLIF